MPSLPSKAEATKCVDCHGPLGRRRALRGLGPFRRRLRPPGGVPCSRLLWGTAFAAALALLAGCSSSPRYRTVPRLEPSAEWPSPQEPLGPERSRIVTAAQSYLGTPYRHGGTTHRGVDCSGLVIAVFAESHIDLPRTSLDQSQVGVAVDASDLLPGDLVFFRTSRGRGVSHVGIFIGNGRFIHASTSARRVRIDALDDDYFRSRLVTAQRVILE